MFLFCKIAKDCNEAAGRAQTLVTKYNSPRAQPNNKVRVNNIRYLY
jgi:hypothetical protein